jgi:hypothetical protein
MIANPRLDAGCFRPPADDAVGVLLEEGIDCQLASLAAAGAEEIAVDVISDAGGLDVVLEILIQIMMAGNVVLLTAFFMQPYPTAASLNKIVANLHLNDGADACEAVDHHRDQSAVPQPEEIRLIGRLWIIGWFLVLPHHGKYQFTGLMSRSVPLGFAAQAVKAKTPRGGVR